MWGPRGRGPRGRSSEREEETPAYRHWDEAEDNMNGSQWFRDTSQDVNHASISYNWEQACHQLVPPSSARPSDLYINQDLNQNAGRGTAEYGGASVGKMPRRHVNHKKRHREHKAGKRGQLGQMREPSLWPLEFNTAGHRGCSRTQSESAISGQEIIGCPKLFYGALFGNESRNIEFKKGGGEYLRAAFSGHLRRYACAFLNSSGGSLLVGVDDDGRVRGLRLSYRQEDQARLLVDSVLKGFLPPLLPHSYSLFFLPVVRPGAEECCLKVLRLDFRAPAACAQQGLYQTDQGEVFLRRDGSVEGPLSAAAIQEWARQKWSGEVCRLQSHVEFLLSEHRLLTQEICRQNRIIADQHQYLAGWRTSSPPAATETGAETLRRAGEGSAPGHSSHCPLLPCPLRARPTSECSSAVIADHCPGAASPAPALSQPPEQSQECQCSRPSQVINPMGSLCSLM